MMSSQADVVRMAGMRLGQGPEGVKRMVSNPQEITARLRYQQTFPRS
tara:strand:- start:530 stop:670 length:141 start_codon:yes stop_codon:yes gene_type:complete